MKRLYAGFKLWLDTSEGDGVLGDGKWILLRTIEREKSLTAACHFLNISYRKAWGDIRKMEKLLNITLVEKHRGGFEGGQSHLTNQGRELVKAYSGFHNEIEKALHKAYTKHIKKLEH
jgi:molybdate transport system regulatory protein